MEIYYEPPDEQTLRKGRLLCEECCASAPQDSHNSVKCCVFSEEASSLLVDCIRAGPVLHPAAQWMSLIRQGTSMFIMHHACRQVDSSMASSCGQQVHGWWG